MRTIVVATLAAAVLAGCGNETSKRATPADLPLTVPPVKAATPAGLLPAAGALSVLGIQERFFTAGPTEVLGLMAAIDQRIEDINRRSEEQEHGCLEQAPVAYDIQAFGETVTFHAQCHEILGYPADPNDPALVQFGKKDGVTYLYYASGMTRAAATVTPVEGAAGEYVVRAWMGVGYLNATSCGNMTGFDDCSYAAMSLRADSSSRSYELAVAGINIGYCGAQLASDGTSVYAIGSEGDSCASPSSACVAASDVATPATCGGSLTTFALPPLGRLATTGPNGTWPASAYPGGSANNIALDGTATDSLHFGPATPTPGVAAF